MYVCTATDSCQQLTAYIAGVPDDALTASSEWSHPTVYHGPTNSRLFNIGTDSSTDAWGGVVTTSQYIQVRRANTTIS